jgi:hypothetical protein
MKPEEKFKLVKISTKVDKGISFKKLNKIFIAQFQDSDKIVEGFRYSDLDTNYTLPVDLPEVKS